MALTLIIVNFSNNVLASQKVKSEWLRLVTHTSLFYIQ